MARRTRPAGRPGCSTGPIWWPTRRRPTTSRWRPRAIPGTALACLIYTSGTGGAPKGVMLPHRSILSNCRGAFELMRPLGLQDEVYLSYLPLSHSYEHTVGSSSCPASAPRSSMPAASSIWRPTC